MQSNALSQPGGAEPCSESFEIFEAGLAGNDLASFADPTGEFQCEKSDIGSDIDDRRSGRHKILLPIYRPRFDPGLVDRISSDKQVSGSRLLQHAGSSSGTICGKADLLESGSYWHEGVIRLGLIPERQPEQNTGQCCQKYQYAEHDRHKKCRCSVYPGHCEKRDSGGLAYAPASDGDRQNLSQYQSRPNGKNHRKRQRHLHCVGY